MGLPSYPPYPKSAFIKSVVFAPLSHIITEAKGSDNWPITWADDNNLYTAYGDGWGFRPYTKKKLSLGFAKVMGSPPDFKGVNIRSQNGERLGDGPRGPKASGILMVDGTLYLWIRNVENSQLAWSEDHCRTWHYGYKFRTSFGSPTFLGFGKDYEGMRDEYLYIYSQDGPSAYESYDGVVLARVSSKEARRGDSYEFFKGFDGSGRATWSHHIEERAPTFIFPGQCQRIDVVYNHGIKRYLMALGFDHKGGFGLFDAQDPWGPWTTAFYARRWDCGDTHSYRLPSKWISGDGRTMWLIFSGMGEYDAFCVRKCILELL